MAKIKQISCPSCKYEGAGKYIVKGYFLIELILWCFIVPGLIYTIWRNYNRKWICPQCDFENVIKKGFLTAPTTSTSFKWSSPGWFNINPMSGKQFIVIMSAVVITGVLCLMVIFPAIYR